MTAQRWILVGVALWLAAVTVAHLGLNLGVFDERWSESHGDKFRVGFLPVT
jgi:hypothetical protein